MENKWKCVRAIELSRDQFAVVNCEDYNWLKEWTWHADYYPSIDGFYARKTEYIGKVNEKYKTKKMLMHRFILKYLLKRELNQSEVVDHINHDPLDNTRENLRLVSKRQNTQNQKRETSSRYPGVHWNKKDKRWQARIQLNGKRIYLGSFFDEMSAAKAYEMAQRLFCNENLICKQNKNSSYYISPKFTLIPSLWGLDMNLSYSVGKKPQKINSK